MTAFTWIIVSSIMLTITIWVHRHTYGVIRQNGKWVADLDDPNQCPLWLLIVATIVFFIPILNITVFCAGALAWLAVYKIEDEIRLGNLPKWLKSVLEFLNRQV